MYLQERYTPTCAGGELTFFYSEEGTCNKIYDRILVLLNYNLLSNYKN